MVDFRTFRGWRPPPVVAARVAAVPYDVVDLAEARALAADPLSLLHVTRPEVNLPDGVSPYSEDAYEVARAAFDGLLDAGALLRDPAPAYYAYAQQMGAHRQVGVMGLASADEYWAGLIKRHELTRADKEEDRVRHVQTLGAHLGPVFLTYRRMAEIDAIIAQASAETPVVDFVAEDEVRHQLWPIVDPVAQNGLMSAFSAVPSLYIADGHHRAAAAARVGREAPQEDDARFFLACAFPHDQLHVLPYNRVVRDLNGHTPTSLWKALSVNWRIETLGSTPIAPVERHTFTLFMGGAWYRLRLAKADLALEADPLARLDVSLLQTHILGPLLGIEDPRRDARIDFVGGIRGLEELQRRAGHDGIAFALHPTSLDELMAIADAGAIMPPKSTWFEPKLRSGMVINRFR